MKKGFFSVIILFVAGIILSGCIKNRPYVTTTNPTMTADIGTFKYVAGTVVTSTIDTQTYDSTTTLIITGNTDEHAHPYDYIKLAVSKFKHSTGVFSIIQGQAYAEYYHNGRLGVPLGGIVAITSYTPQTVTGYFSFDTQDTVHIRNGSFTANLPY